MNNRGQALIETAAFFLALVPLLVCLLGYTQWFSIRQKMIMAARGGALIYSSGRFTKSETEQLMRDYLSTGTPALTAAQPTAGPHPNLVLRIYQLDQAKVTYTPQSRWMRAIGLNSPLEESCTVKHASQFGPEWQPAYGPPVNWFGIGPLFG